MGKNRRPTKRNRASASASAASVRAELNLEPLITTLLWSLFFVRWLIPTEGTAEGDSLWLAAFTLPVAAIWFWWQSRREISRVAPGLIDAAIWSLAGAHILSAIFVIAGEGEKRLAMNMLWEWFSLAVLVSTLRQTLLSQTARERFLQTLVALGIALSLFGIWQHYFWYAENVREYDTRRSELDELEASTSLDAADLLRKSKLQSDFLRESIPLSGPQRGLFEIRLRDSSEPLGFFALANSFAGILSVVIVLLVAGLLRSIIPVIQPRFTSDGSRAPPTDSVVLRETPTSIQKWIQENCVTIGCLAVVGFTLLLTKSRTAFIGTAAGIGFAAFMSLAGLNRDALKRVAVVAALAILMAGVLTGGAIATGALDIEVLSEAPKSIQYRFQYWSGTARVIARSPWFGVGPGNFRSHYLQHKLAETSEEIADPHNFLFDVMANAGVPGVLALILLAAVFVRSTRSLFLNQRRELDQPASRKATDQAAIAPSPATVICGAIAIAAGWQFVAEAYLNSQLLSVGVLAVGFAATSSCLQSNGREIPGSSLTPTAFAAATVGLLVHLLAAGGIAMPAICGCLLVLLALTQPPRTHEKESHVESPLKSRAVSLVLAVALVTTFAACLQSAFLPVIRATTEIQSGDYEATLQSRYDRARTRYSLAAQLDPLSPGPLMRLADVSFLFWEQTRDDDRFIEGVNFAVEAETRNPHSGFYAYQIGRRYRQRFRMSRDEEHAQAAVEWLSKALRLYPTHPLWNAEYTIALDEAGRDQEAIPAAETTLRFEEINQAAGHLDKFLPEPVLSEIQRIAGVDQTATE